MSLLGAALLPIKHQPLHYVRKARRKVSSETCIHIHSRSLKNTCCSVRPEDRSQRPSQHQRQHRDHPFFTKPSLTLKFLTYLFPISLLFSSILVTFFLALSLLQPDFSHRWHQLVATDLGGDNEEDETSDPNINSTSIFKSNGAVLRKRMISVSPGDIPSHLWQAVVASEDRRFFEHRGVDPVSISRAVLSFSAAGGGSTITQQIYWGHGTYGIGAASSFYFGKHPSRLSLGESAMLAGIIPAPEILSPLNHLSRGKKPQARVLRRMVESGFLDIDTAVRMVNQPLCLHVDCLEHAGRLWQSPYLAEKEAVEESKERKSRKSLKEEIWDWERESNFWEVKEIMKKWAREHRKKTAFINSVEKRMETF